ncbi:acetolactate decarboxylase [Algoriphagus sp. D3-2-R+10]|uniref:acetolactate decarboxylase n=1 Tax=Algoriphagus aurantiacus TaxID=3103948 RepID=UPI002B3BB405|nr:acetolactate decarboxylase [Algoriphagus sp. D3-2-R+10]MEB2777423.1 acetolactate decarboxylase [Algoriphagus sp. D3-2-R+10]
MKLMITIVMLLIFFKVEAQVMHSGSMSEMSQNGFESNVLIDSLLQRPHLYGLGPYGKMQGEITVIDGQPFIAFADENSQLKVKIDSYAEAPFFVYAYVAMWQTFEMSSAIANLANLQAAIEKLADEQGYDLSKPFPFRIKGDIDSLTIHVVAPRSLDIPGYKEGVNSYKYDVVNISGEIFGFYSPNGMGVYTHRDSKVHVHFISSDHFKMGHIDALHISPKRPLQVLLPALSK